MSIVLTSKERDQGVLALQDIQGLLEYTRRAEFKDLDEVQTILASRGLQIAPIPKPAPLVLTSAPAQAQAAAPVSTKVSANDQYWIETVIQKYQHAKQSNIAGFNFKNEAVGRLLAITCPVLDIPFKL